MKKSILKVLIGSFLLLTTNTAYGLECGSAVNFIHECMQESECVYDYFTLIDIGCLDDRGLTGENHSHSICTEHLPSIASCRSDCRQLFNSQCLVSNTGGIWIDGPDPGDARNSARK